MRIVYNKSLSRCELSINVEFLMELIFHDIIIRADALQILLHLLCGKCSLYACWISCYEIILVNFCAKNKSCPDFKTGGIKNFAQTKVKFQLATAAKRMVIHMIEIHRSKRQSYYFRSPICIFYTQYIRLTFLKRLC